MLIDVLKCVTSATSGPAMGFVQKLGMWAAHDPVHFGRPGDAAGSCVSECVCLLGYKPAVEGALVAGTAETSAARPSEALREKSKKVNSRGGSQSPARQGRNTGSQ